MFQNDYKNEIDKIKPDGFIKYRIRERLSSAEEAPRKITAKAYLGKVIAAVLCLCLVFGAGAILGRRTADTPTVQSTPLMKSVKNYDGVYKELEKFKPTFLDNIIDYATDEGYKNSDAEVGLYAETETADSTTAKPAYNKNNGSSDTADSDHSETTAQVEGVDEADIVKTDGKYIYILTENNLGNAVKIVDAREKAPKQLNSISVSGKKNLQEMYLVGDRLILLNNDYGNNKTEAIIYDVSNPEAVKEIEVCSQSGDYNTSRLTDSKLYIISNYYVNVSGMEKDDSKSFVPAIESKNFNDTVSAECIHLYNSCTSPIYTVVTAYDVSDGKMLSTQSVLGGSYTVYASTDNIITTSNTNNNETQVARFKLEGDEIKLTATGTLKGSLLNQFSIDEYKDHFRFVLTETKIVEEETVTNSFSKVKTLGKSITLNSLVILNSELKQVGKISDIAPDERVYSVRFMGDIAYFVTFRQVDPLFSADLSDPENPKIIGALKIPGFSNYLFPFGEGKLFGIGQNADEITGRTGCIKLSMFDISDPSNVTENDKTDVDAYYSAALHNHKAILADYGKNIIAFSAQGNQICQYLYVYSYENGRFTERLSEKLDVTKRIIRPMYIGDTFYIITEDEIRYFNINTLEKLGNLYLN